MDNLKRVIDFNKVFSIFMALVVLAIYIPFIFNGGVIYDDWSVLSLGAHHPGIVNSYSAYFSSFSNRPLAPLLLGMVSNLFGQNVTLYILLTLIFWISSTLVVATVLKKYFNNVFFTIFITIAIFPVFSSVVIFSPAMLLIGSSSVFLWSMSLFFLNSAISKSKTVFYALSYFLAICSVLVYEVVLPLFIISALWPLIRLKKDCFSFTKSGILKYLSKFVSPFAIIVALIFIYQKVIVPLFASDISRLRFEGLIIIPQVFAKFLTVITLDIPYLLLSSLSYVGTQVSFFDLMAVILLPALLAVFYLKNRKPISVIPQQQKIFIISAVSALVSLLPFYMLAGVIPTINGYYNRGLISFSLALAMVIAFLGYYAYIKKSRWFFIIPVFIFLYLASFVVQRNNYIDSWRLQNFILGDVLQKANENNLPKEAVVLGNVPEYLKYNFNNETVFSDEVGDFGIALGLKGEGRLSLGDALTKVKIDNGRVKILDGGIAIDGHRADIKDIWFYQYSLKTKQSFLEKVIDVNQLKGIVENISKDNLNETHMPLEAWWPIIAEFKKFKNKINNND